MCAHFNKIYICAYSYYDNLSFLKVPLKIKKFGYWFSKIVPGGVSWPQGPTEEPILTQRKKKIGPP
jgi:hypothetical protein